MPEVSCRFNVRIGDVARVSSDFIYLESPEAVKELALIAGIEVNADEEILQFRVELDEGAPELHSLLQALKRRYGFEPNKRRPIPPEDRQHVFWMQRWRTYLDRELDQYELLCISFVDRIIAGFRQGTPEQVEAEQYCVDPGTVDKEVRLGTLMPFHGLGVKDDLRAELETLGLKSLKFATLVDGDGISLLSSSVVMPRCQLPLVDGEARLVEPDDWPTKFSRKNYDDRGYYPPVLSYKTEEVRALPPFDIAVTRELVGGASRPRAFRMCIVSQKFRSELQRLKVPAILYTPVKLL